MNEKAALAIFYLRIVLGSVFLMMGMDKLFGIGGGEMADVADVFSGIGFAADWMWAWILALAEAVSGFFLTLGIFPRLSGMIISISILFTLFLTGHHQTFVFGRGGLENTLILLGVSLFFFAYGGGKYSLVDVL